MRLEDIESETVRTDSNLVSVSAGGHLRVHDQPHFKRKNSALKSSNSIRRLNSKLSRSNTKMARTATKLARSTTKMARSGILKSPSPRRRSELSGL